MKKQLAAVLTGLMLLSQGAMVSADTSVVDQIPFYQKEGWKDVSDQRQAQKTGEIYDYPGLRDGQIIREIQTGEQFEQIGLLYDTWSCVTYQDENNVTQVGYILDDVFREIAEEAEAEPESDLEGEGIIRKSSGSGIFAEASETERIAAETGEVIMAAEGTPLRSLGRFKITHYCACAICCGPYTNGITSTGVTAVTNHTIAVDPTQIPYGSSVVIDGQVYVAEDCGGAIKKNCIDIYVATHEEGDTKGVYYTEVFVIE